MVGRTVYDKDWDYAHGNVEIKRYRTCSKRHVSDGQKEVTLNENSWLYTVPDSYPATPTPTSAPTPDSFTPTRTPTATPTPTPTHTSTPTPTVDVYTNDNSYAHCYTYANTDTHRD